MAYQPRGIFIGSTSDELATIRTAALARINGQIVSVSEAGQSYTRSAGMPPDEVLIEVSYAQRLLSGGIIRTTRPDFSRRDCYSGGWNPQEGY